LRLKVKEGEKPAGKGEVLKRSRSIVVDSGRKSGGSPPFLMEGGKINTPWRLDLRKSMAREPLRGENTIFQRKGID